MLKPRSNRSRKRAVHRGRSGVRAYITKKGGGELYDHDGTVLLGCIACGRSPPLVICGIWSNDSCRYRLCCPSRHHTILPPAQAADAAAEASPNTRDAMGARTYRAAAAMTDCDESAQSVQRTPPP